MNEILGESKCCVCGADVEVRASKKGKAYFSCGECQFQGFARGMKSDNLLRKQAKPLEKVEPEKELETESEGGIFGGFFNDD